MKRLYHIFILFYIIFLTSCHSKAANTEQSASQENGDFLAYNGDFHKEIIAPQVKAWQEVAKVMYPRVCDDTETEWAAQQVDSLATALLDNHNIPYGEQLARLYEIENMVCYGMSYFSAVIGTYSNPEEASEALSLMQRSYAFSDTLKIDGYKNAQLLNDFEQSVYFNFGNFMILGTQYHDGEPQFVTNNINMNEYNFAADYYLFQQLKDDTQAFRYCTYINNTSFFMTLCPLAFWFAGEEFQQANQEEYIKIGGWYDEQAAPVLSALHSNKVDKLKPISDEEYSVFLKQSSEYRTRLINLFAKAIQSVK